MVVRRRRRPGSDRLYVTTDTGLPLGHLDLATRAAHDVPAGWRGHFLEEVNSWLWANNMPTVGGLAGHVGTDDERDIAPARPVLDAGVPVPDGGWDTGWEDLALHLPGHGLADEAARARTTAGREADRPARLRADGRQTVAEALGKLTGEWTGGRRPTRGARSGGRSTGRGARWRILHAVPMAMPDEDVVLDHVVIGPPGAFVIEVHNDPGGRVVVGQSSLEIDQEEIDLARRREIGDEAARRLSEGLARAAGATETLNPPTVTPVVAVVGAILVGGDRPRGVLVSRAGQLPRLLHAFGSTLSDQAVAQTWEVARRSMTWTP